MGRYSGRPSSSGRVRSFCALAHARARAPSTSSSQACGSGSSMARETHGTRTAASNRSPDPRIGFRLLGPIIPKRAGRPARTSAVLRDRDLEPVRVLDGEGAGAPFLVARLFEQRPAAGLDPFGQLIHVLVGVAVD